MAIAGFKGERPIFDKMRKVSIGGKSFWHGGSSELSGDFGLILQKATPTLHAMAMCKMMGEIMPRLLWIVRRKCFEHNGCGSWCKRVSFLTLDHPQRGICSLAENMQVIS
jgi:hypothetical protein